MPRLFVLLTALFIVQIVFGQNEQSTFLYAASESHPYGLLHPEAPKEVADYAALIGLCDCQSVSRIDQTTWADTVQLTWTFKYIMNGTGVQDETLKSDGTHSGSIRQFNADSSRWYVHYYSSSAATPTLSTWEGGMNDDQIILYKEQQAPNGIEGYYKIVFSNIGESGFHWVGAWVTLDESFSYPTWKIFCNKRQ